MRFCILLTMVLIESMALAQASERCLRDATDHQLVNELERRLGGSSGGESALADFFCDSSTNLHISLVDQYGAETNEQIYIGSQTRCRDKLPILREIREIRRLAIIAVCDTSTNLRRYTLKPDGSIGELESRYIGNQTLCLEEEQSINSRD